MNVAKGLTNAMITGLAAGLLAGCATAETATQKAAAAHLQPAAPHAKPGFHTELDKDGRLWVFKADSKELEEFKAKGKPAKHVVRPAAGPMGLTVKAVDFETIDAYLAAK